MPMLYAVRALVLLCVSVWAMGGRAHTAALNGAAPLISQQAHERDELDSVVRSILQKHEANADLQNLQAALADVRPAAAIACSDNDIGIEFDLNDQVLVPQRYPLQHIYTTAPQRQQRLVETAADVYCGDEQQHHLLPKGSEPQLRWSALGGGHSLTRLDYEQMAAPPQVSVHQYGTNYYQHNSYTMPATTATSVRTDNNAAGYKAASAQSTAKVLSARPASMGAPSTNDLDGTTSKAWMGTVTPLRLPAISKDLHVENIYVIQRNRTKKDRETNGTKQCQTVVSIRLSGNGKPANLTALRRLANGARSLGTLPLAVAATTTSTTTATPPSSQQTATTGQSLPTTVDGSFDYTNDNVGMLLTDDSGQQAQLKAHSTTKRSIDRTPVHRSPTTNSISDESREQFSTSIVADQPATWESSTSDPNVMSTTIRSQARKPVTNTKSQATTRGSPDPKLRATVSAPQRNATRPGAGKGKLRRPAETNYYYYYTKPTLMRNRKPKRVRKPFKVNTEPIAFEALDKSFIAKHSVALPQHNYIAEHLHNINNMRHINTTEKQQQPDDTIDDDVKCLDHDDKEHVLLKQTSNRRIKDIIAGRKDKYRQDSNVHYYRELRPFEEPLDGTDCMEDETTSSGKPFNRQKPKTQASRDNGRNDSQSDYFVCDDDDYTDDTTEAMARFNPSGER